MRAVHDVGVIHRNINAANIFLTELGRPKVSSFELALIGKPRVGMRERLNAAYGAFRSSLSAKYLHPMRGDIVGTIAYMPPEQASGQRDIDHRADIYSLGATLYDLLTLRAPFYPDRTANVRLWQRVMTEEAPDVREIRPGLSPGLAEVCMKALRRDPSERYQTMSEFGDDLTSVREHSET
jgi:serine/threonine protein kinase